MKKSMNVFSALGAGLVVGAGMMVGAANMHSRPQVVGDKEAGKVKGGDIFSACSFPTCNSYGTCSTGFGGEYYSDPVSTTKSCTAASYPYCGDQPKKVTCVYQVYSDRLCTVHSGTQSITSPYCALLTATATSTVAG